jgi:endonuclease III
MESLAGTSTVQPSAGPTGEVLDVESSASAFDFLLALILTHGQRADRAWRAPRQLKARLAIGESLLAHELDAASVSTALAQKPALARFPRTAGTTIERLAGVLRAEYQSDARQVWSGRSVREAEDRIRALPGFANKRASVALYLLIHQFAAVAPDDAVEQAVSLACPRLFRTVRG